MDSVVKGWDWETDQLVNDPKKPHWTNEKKDLYMAKHMAMKIVTRPEGLTKAEKKRRIEKSKIKKSKDKK
jgi:hypothetical protein